MTKENINFELERDYPTYLLPFDFLFGEFVINTKTLSLDLIHKLEQIQDVQTVLLDLLPHRKNEICQFIVQCLVDLNQSSISSKVS